VHRAEYKRREGNCLEIERLCRDAHAKGVLMFTTKLLRYKIYNSLKKLTITINCEFIINYI
uniref:hypothetical protein n=1 Tax=Arsenophonus nasoniae TaxID=638 RepID=UPI001B7FEEFC